MALPPDSVPAKVAVPNLRVLVDVVFTIPWSNVNNPLIEIGTDNVTPVELLLKT